MKLIVAPFTFPYHSCQPFEKVKTTMKHDTENLQPVQGSKSLVQTMNKKRRHHLMEYLMASYGRNNRSSLASPDKSTKAETLHVIRDEPTLGDNEELNQERACLSFPKSDSEANEADDEITDSSHDHEHGLRQAKRLSNTIDSDDIPGIRGIIPLVQSPSSDSTQSSESSKQLELHNAASWREQSPVSDADDEQEPESTSTSMVASAVHLEKNREGYANPVDARMQLDLEERVLNIRLRNATQEDGTNDCDDVHVHDTQREDHLIQEGSVAKKVRLNADFKGNPTGGLLGRRLQTTEDDQPEASI
jgi:hypothetical protein